jgi:(p)ppGpp synthase/HD superfamily hydrolase
MKEVFKALYFASNAHAGQFRKGPKHEEYIHHLIEVVHILVNADVNDSNTLMIAALHDVLEDTEVSENKLCLEFGDYVTDGVKLLSDDKSLPLSERRAYQIIHAENLPDNLKLVKIADHCSNVINIPMEWGKKKINEYLNWSGELVSNCNGINEQLDNEYVLRAKRIKKIYLIDKL